MLDVCLCGNDPLSSFWFVCCRFGLVLICERSSKKHEATRFVDLRNLLPTAYPLALETHLYVTVETVRKPKDDEEWMQVSCLKSHTRTGEYVSRD
mmetsp:Transcript_11262/g.16453  ORF Transcript_11262/g.16453 Transcript_11262/m.16453 type:complete len:95 (+) Transcript_11262:1746-2030(+)